MHGKAHHLFVSRGRQPHANRSCQVPESQAFYGETTLYIPQVLPNFNLRCLYLVGDMAQLLQRVADYSDMQI